MIIHAVLLRFPLLVRFSFSLRFDSKQTNGHSNAFMRMYHG